MKINLNESLEKLYGFDDIDEQLELAEEANLTADEIAYQKYQDGEYSYQDYCDVCEAEGCEPLEEGIFDNIKDKVKSVAHDLKVNKGYNDDFRAAQASRREFDARRAANATQSPDNMLDADREAKNRIELQHQADLKRAKKQSTGIEDEIMRKAQVNKAYADEKRQAAQMHKQDVSNFMANASKSMSKIKNKATLDAMYYDYLDAMRKSSKGGLKYSDPMYKELTKEYQALRSKLKK